MDAGTLSIKDIFGSDRRLIVPLFQRPYVWTKELQWEPLWDDVRSVADRVVSGKDGRPHFLGAIVLDMLPKPTGHMDTRLVIDGQQRLVTIQLILEAFSDFCAERGWSPYDKALCKLTRNDDPMSQDEDEQFKVWPTNVDQEHFRKVMLFSSPAELLKDYGRSAGAKTAGNAIADAYLFFHRRVEEWLEPDADGFDRRVDALYRALREYVRLVVIDLEKEDDAQLIFETLNARGTPLLPSDLVKNYLFHRAQIEGEKIEPLYKRYWWPLDEDGEYWRRELGRGHARRARIDTFLQHYLTLKTEDEVHVAEVFNTFRDFVQNTTPQMGSPEHLASLLDYSDVFRSFDQLPEHSRERIFFDRLRLMEIITAYPFLLELVKRFRDEMDEVRLILDDLESFLVRRMVCQLNTRAYGKLFIDMLSALTAEDGPPSVRLRRFLLASQAETRRWPDDTEFREAWLWMPMYRSLVRARVRMLLESLERQLQSESDCSEKITFGEKLTVEHILPQSWQAHWPLPVGVHPAEAQSLREQRVHTIGNLTLVTKKLNPKVSNGPWEKKRRALKTHSGLALNRLLQEIDIWDEDAIERRARGLFKKACKIWPFPGGVEQGSE